MRTPQVVSTVLLCALTVPCPAATVEVGPDQIVIGNDLITRTVSLKDGVFRTVRFTDVPGKIALDVTDQGPHLRLISGKEIPAAALHVSGPITTIPPTTKEAPVARGGQVSVNVPVACTQPAAVKMDIHLRVVDGQHFTHKWCEVVADEPVDTVQVEQLTGDIKPALGGRGQPLFINGQWFTGLEYPAGYHEASSGQLRLYHFPGRPKFTSKRAVWGTNIDGNLADSFEAYLSAVRIKPRGLLQYNSWYDLRGTELAAETLSSRFQEFRKAFLDPYGLHFDAFVADDGWQNPESIWDVNRKILPQGYKPLADALAQASSRVGLWLPLNGTNLDVGWGVKQGYEKSNHGDYYCLAAGRYRQAIRKATEVRIRDGNLSYYKHDFNWFRCSATGHEHLPTPRHGFEANVDALLDLLAYERSLQPGIFLNVTSGTWPSPWWLPHADSIWMGGGDFGYDKHYPQLSPRQWAMSYRDQQLFEQCRIRQEQYPISALATNGVIHGRRNRLGGPNETLRDWSDYVVLYLARGVMLKELYLTPSLLDADWWDVLGGATQWAIHNAETFVHTRMVGAEPRAGGLYGYVHWSRDKGILALRNPAPFQQSYELSLAERPRRMGLGRIWDVEVVYPHRELLGEQLAADRKVKLDVPPCSVVVWELMPSAERVTTTTASAPSAGPRGLRRVGPGRWCRSGDVAADIQVTPGKIVQPPSPATTQATTQPAPSAPPTLSLEFILPPAQLARADVLLIARGASQMPVGPIGINGKPAGVAKVEGVDWQMLQIDCAGLTGKVALSAPIAQGSTPFVFSPPMLEAWLLAELPLRVTGPTTSSSGAPTTSASAPGSRPATTAPQPTTTSAVPTSVATTAPATTIPATSTSAASAPAVATASRPSAQAAQVAPPSTCPADRPLPRAYRPECLRTSYRLLEPTALGTSNPAIKPEELAAIKAAKLRIELYDVNGGAYADKHILLNGQPLCQIPPGKGPGSEWQEEIIDLPPDWLKRLQMTNTIQLTNGPHDLFKFRGIALAVLTPDGRWVTSSLANTVHSSSPNWRYAEGEIFEADKSPEIKVAFPAGK
ncbi:MAG: hypothetical protein JXQ73_15975 [Phycisphaerae bacterium]|nr:hypothetical protein [Phycisphaerae bacterium]